MSWRVTAMVAAAAAGSVWSAVPAPVSRAAAPAATAASASAPASASASLPWTTGRGLVRLVDPFVGTDTSLADQGTGGSAGNMSPAAAAPFGMLEFGPRTSPDSTAFGAGYTYSDKRIAGFDLTRFQGGGCTGFGDVPLIPTTASVSKSPAAAGSFALDRSLLARFSHRHETASPGRYSVQLDPGTRRSIGVRLAAASRSGVGVFRFPRHVRTGSIVVNAGGSESADEKSSVRVDPRARTVLVTVKTGRFCYQPTSYTLHVVLHFDRPFASHGVWQREAFHEGGNAASDTTVLPLGYSPGPGLPPTAPGNPSGTAQAGAVLRFATAGHRRVGVRVGLSYVSSDGAAAAIRHEIGSRSLRSVAVRTAAKWARLLGRIRVAGGTATDRRMLATMTYQSLLSPQLVSDVNGDYQGLDGKVHRAHGWSAYSQMSLWDEYRTHAQLMALVDPSVARDVARTLLADEAQAGFLPRWPIVGQSPDIMVGDPAVPYLADFEAFGVRGFSRRAALRAAVRGAASNGVDDQSPGALPAAGDPETAGGGYYVERPGNPAYLRLHYVPTELDPSTNTTGGIEFVASPEIVWGSASTGLEYATADFAASKLAEHACDRTAAATYQRRAAWWRNDFDPATGYVAPRGATGAFVNGSETGSAHGFVEGDGSQYTFMVPFDVAGLRTALGGARSMTARLDELFAQLNAGPESAHAFLGNEPQLDTPYAYLWAGRPDRTQSVVHRALRTLYRPAPSGYPGNDDGGTMSAWWVFNALGLFPAIPGDDVMSVGAPLFDRESIQLPGTRSRLRISAPGAGRGRPYVSGVRVHGRQTSRDWVRWSSLRHGGSLQVRVQSRPSSFARTVATAPPSYPAAAQVACHRS